MKDEGGDLEERRKKGERRVNRTMSGSAIPSKMLNMERGGIVSECTLNYLAKEEGRRGLRLWTDGSGGAYKERRQGSAQALDHPSGQKGSAKMFMQRDTLELRQKKGCSLDVREKG